MSKESADTGLPNIYRLPPQFGQIVDKLTDAMVDTFTKGHPLSVVTPLRQFDAKKPPLLMNLSKTSDFSFGIYAGPAPDNNFNVKWSKQFYITDPLVFRRSSKPNRMGDHDEIRNPSPNAKFTKQIGSEVRTIMTQNHPIFPEKTKTSGRYTVNSAITDISDFCDWYTKEIASVFLTSTDPPRGAVQGFNANCSKARGKYAKATTAESKQEVVQDFLDIGFVSIRKVTERGALVGEQAPMDQDEMANTKVTDRVYFIFRQPVMYPVNGKDESKAYIPDDPKLIEDINFINTHAKAVGVYNPCEVFVLDANKKHWVKLSHSSADKAWPSIENLVVSVIFAPTTTPKGGGDHVNNALRYSAICIWGRAGDQVPTSRTRDNTVYVTDPQALSVLDSLAIWVPDTSDAPEIPDSDMLLAVESRKRKFDELSDIERHPISDDQEPPLTKAMSTDSS